MQEENKLALQAKNLPTMQSVETLFATANAGKAMSVGSILADLYKMFPQLLARYHLPVMLKAALRIEGSVQYKGKFLVHLSKGKAATSLCGSSRGIFVNATPAR
jgi:hypothetical protein